CVIFAQRNREQGARTTEFAQSVVVLSYAAAGAIAEFWRWREGSGGGLGLRRGRIAGDLDPVSDPHTLDQFWQLVMAEDPAPIFLGALDKLEDHGKRRLVRHAAF